MNSPLEAFVCDGRVRVTSVEIWECVNCHGRVVINQPNRTWLVGLLAATRRLYACVRVCVHACMRA